jgi:hypothetical protein
MFGPVSANIGEDDRASGTCVRCIKNY